MNAVLIPVPAVPLRRVQDQRQSRWVGFELGVQRYAVPIEGVREVLAHADIEPVPGAPMDVLGVTNLRGRIVTVLELSRRLGLGLPAAAGSCIVVVEHQGEPVALRVDRIAELYAVADNAIHAPPQVARNGGHPAVRGVVSRGERIITLLDVAGLLNEHSDCPAATPGGHGGGDIDLF